MNKPSSALSFLSLIFLLSPNYLSAQTLDANFLEALPASIRGDVLEQMSDASSMNEPKKFNAPDTSIDQLEESLSKIKSKLTDIEDAMNSEKTGGLAFLSKPKPFGVDFFSSFQTTFMPINDPNAVKEYVVDIGDSLKIQTIGGQKTNVKPILVERDGSVLIPEIGKVQVAGLNLNTINKLIYSLYQDAFIGREAFVSLSYMRDMNILVIGSANKPGMYTVSGGSTILSVLHAAGGMNDQGSMRSIIIKRNNKVLQEVDLYEALIKGNVNLGSSLRSGDVILVNQKLPQVTITGGVPSPAIYEIKPNESLEDLIELAGNTMPGASDGIEIRRIMPGNTIDIIKVPFDGTNKFQLQNGDSIQVPYYSAEPNPINTVELSGQVVLPGMYTIKPGQTLLELVNEAGGYTDNAYEPGGLLYRESAKIKEKEYNDRIYSDMIKFLATSPNAKEVVSGGSSSLPLILSEFKNVAPVGRVTAEFNLSKLSSNPNLDTKLQNADRIHIPEFNQEIYVLGEVITPGTRLYNSDFQPDDYIELSGGIGKFGDQGRIIVIKPNGDSYLVTKSFFALGMKKNFMIPGSVIYVPREIGKLEGLNYAGIVAPIFSSLALSLASLNSID
ncbi:SLBB domain-containing protein [Gammaproteobacteria bacterium]|nr:SLBB domain-containing protein [Gammaproteobacteria bacterium]MDA9258884.1 SLBB domain-containing protein [Gammaproteobacteria bacterium]